MSIYCQHNMSKNQWTNNDITFSLDERMEENCQTLATPCKAVKRRDVEAHITMPKKVKKNSSETTDSTIFDDCIIIESPKIQIQVDFIDLTDDSIPIVPVLCSPAKTSHLENRLPNTPKTILQAKCDVPLIVEPNKVKFQVKADTVDIANLNYHGILVKAEQNKPNKNNSEINTDNPHVDMNKTINISLYSPAHIEVVAEKNMSNESKNGANFGESPIKTLMKIKKVQESIFFDENVKDNVSPVSYFSTNTLVRNDAEKINFPESFCNYEKPQNYNDKLRKSFNFGSPEKNSSVSLISEQINKTCVHSYADSGIFSGDSQSHEQRRPGSSMINYLNFNKVDDLEISDALSFLENLTKNVDQSYRNTSEVMPDSADLQDELKMCTTKGKEESAILQVNEKQLLNVKSEEISDKISSESNVIESVSFKPNLTTDEHQSYTIRTEVIPNSVDSQEEFKLCIHKLREESVILQENEKQLLNIKSDQSLQKMPLESSVKESMKFEQNISNIDSNSASSLEKSINDVKVQKSLYTDSLNDEMWQNNSPIIDFQSPAGMSDSSARCDSDATSISFYSEMGSGSSLENNSPRTKCLSPFDDHKLSETSENLPMEVKETLKNKQVESLTLTSLNEKKAKITMNPFSKDLLEQSTNVFKRTRVFNPLETKSETPEADAKRFKMSENTSISKNGDVKKISFDEYKKREKDNRIMKDHLSKPQVLNYPSKPGAYAPGYSNFQQNTFIYPGYVETCSIPIYLNTFLQKPESQLMASTVNLRDPRLARNYSVEGVKTYQPHLSRNSELTHDYNLIESVNNKLALYPLPTVSNLSTPFPPTLPVVQQLHYIAFNPSQNSSLHNSYNSAATQNVSIPNQPSSEFVFVSLLPKQLKKDIGKIIINTNDVYLIIIEKRIDWIHGIDEDNRVSRISEIGGEFRQVLDNYANHVEYYNTYFLLLLLECFSKISTALKEARTMEKIHKNNYKIVNYETKQSYVSFKCEGFVHHSDLEDIPRDGHIVLVKFATFPAGSVKMLGYVSSSATRPYSHARDHGHDILKYMNRSNCTDLVKIKVAFYIVFDIPAINLGLPINVIKLTNINKVLILNEALKDLLRSPLYDTVLSPQNHSIMRVALPHRKDKKTLTAVVQAIVQSINPLFPTLTVFNSAPFTDSALAIVQIVEEILKSSIPGKILVCVRKEMLSQMGIKLIETNSNLIIIKRDRESLHENLQSKVLDGMVSRLSKVQKLSDNVARSKVLQEGKVLLAVNGTCFYKDVQCIADDLTHCIIQDAHSFTEPESLLPLMYGVRHLLLFGDIEVSCHLNSKRATRLGYNKSLCHRVYNLC